MTDELLIRFRLVGEEARALRLWAAEEMRKPRDQLRFLLRSELEEQGRLQMSDDTASHQEGVDNGTAV